MSLRRIEWRVASGHWQELFPGVYRLAGAPRTWHQQLTAVSLWVGHGLAFSHRTAAALWGFSSFREGRIEVTVTRRLRDDFGVVVHQVGRLDPADTCRRGDFRVTTAARALLELGAGEPAANVRASLDEALRRKWTTLHHLQRLIHRSTHHRGVGLLRDLVAALVEGEAPAESELEARVVELLEAEGLPRPIRQQRVLAGGRVRRLDFRIPGAPVVIEADVYATHASAADFERDRARNNALTAREYRVLHWTWAAVRDHPEQLAAQLRQMLASCSAGPR